MNVRVTSASAGTGKTRWLAEHLAGSLLAEDAGIRVRSEAVVAITYTRKAAAELESRLRRRLIEAGEWRMAHALADGYIGTIHSVGQRLLREFALEGGLSPEQQVMPESEAERLFRESLGTAIGDDRHAALDAAARRMAIDDWRDPLREVIDHARANRLGPAELEASRRRSLQGFLALLPAPGDADRRDRALRRELDRVRAALEARAGESQAAEARARAAADLDHAFRRGHVPRWRDQLAAAKTLGGVEKLRPLVGDLCTLLEDHPEDPRLRDDVRTVVDGIFGLAAEVLEAYDERKRAARAVDYNDMLATALDLLEHPGVADALSERLELVLVDEFQDVSPLQLALVMRLGALAGRAAWVGDPKQAIFGFQGSDPELVEAAARHVLGPGEPEVLDTSYRSRAPLVDLCSDWFARALAPHGFREREVRIRPAAPDPEALADTPALGCWAWDPTRVRTPLGRVTPKEAEALAEGVEALLDAPPLVRERDGAPTAPRLRPADRRDVAVLVRTNARARAVAGALHGRGIPAAVALEGLMDQPEARLARAALALVADPTDGVAAAEVAWLSGNGAGDPDGWLSARIEEEAAWRAAREAADGEDGEGGDAGPRAGPRPLPFDDAPRVRALREAARRVGDRSPSEAFALALDAAGLHRLCLAWPDGDRRLANLEALRARVAEYEELCRVQRSAGTVAGLVNHLSDAGGGGGSGPERGEQAMPTDPDAVTVVTYHRAKGLEWPVVVLGHLDDSPKADVFGVHLTAPADGFDAERPLEGRRIRYWPWPYGKRRKEIALGDAAAGTEEARRVEARETRERARLLYVGATRARDRLVFVGKAKPGEAAATRWLDELRDEEGAPVLELPWDADGAATARVRGHARTWPCPVRPLRGLPADRPAVAEAERRWFAAAGAAAEERTPEVVSPSAAPPRPRATVERVDRIGPRPALAGRTDDMARVGDAVHAFLAADLLAADPERREATARHLLASHDLLDLVPPPSLLAMADAFGSWIRSNHPGATIHCEWPVRRRFPDPDAAGAERLLVGEVDLVLDHPDGLAVVDHKSYAGDPEGRDARLPGYAGQLHAYADALTAATGRPVTGTYVHLPLMGEVLRLAV